MPTKKTLCNFCTVVAIFAPILNVYGISSSLNTFTFREVFVLIALVLCFLFALLKKDKTISAPSVILLFFITMVFFSLLVNLLSGEKGFELRVVRYIAILIFSFGLLPSFFNIQLGFKLYRFVAVVSGLFLICQVISANIFGFELKGYLPFLPTRSSNLLVADGTKRFYSFFEEPGYYGMYTAGYLCISLFDKRFNAFNFKNIFCWGVIAIACLLSTSTTSIVTLLFVVILYFFFHKDGSFLSKRSRAVFFVKTLVLLTVVVAFFIFSKLPQFQTVINRIEQGDSASARFDGYSSYWKFYTNDSLVFLFGNCMQDYPIGGMLALFVCFGLFGGLLFLAYLLCVFLRTNKTGKMLIVIFLMLNIANVEFLGNASTIITYFGFVFCYMNKRQRFAPSNSLLLRYGYEC